MELICTYLPVVDFPWVSSHVIRKPFHITKLNREVILGLYEGVVTDLDAIFHAISIIPVTEC